MTTTLLNPGCGSCNDCCPIKWVFIDCRLYWKVVNPPTSYYGVTISGPGGYNQSFTNQPNGMIEQPATGTWIASLLLPGYYSPSAECEITIENCTPIDPCCINTIGVHGIVSGVPESIVQAQTTTVGYFPGYYGFSRLDAYEFGDLNCSWYRALEMIDPAVKTEHICYDRIELGRILIGEATERTYSINPKETYESAIRPASSLTEADAIAAYNYWKRETFADLYLVFASQIEFYIIAKITSSIVTTVGIPPGLRLLDPYTVDSESKILDVNVWPHIFDYYTYGVCGYHSGRRVVNSISGETPLTIQANYVSWPEIGP